MSSYFIFLDESGDLGFDFQKSRTTKYFLITFLLTTDKRPIEKLVKETHHKLKKIHKKKGGVLHCHNEKPATRKKLLEKLLEQKCRIMTVFLNKKRVYTKLHDEKNVLYNYVTNILLDRIRRKKLLPVDEKITLIASRKETNKFLNENFKTYLANKLKTNHKLQIEIMIKSPHEEKALQAVDFVSWSIFRKYEYEDESYYFTLRIVILVSVAHPGSVHHLNHVPILDKPE